MYIFFSMCIFNSIGVFYYLFRGAAYYVPDTSTYIYLLFAFFAFTLGLFLSSRFSVVSFPMHYSDESRIRHLLVVFISFVPFLYILTFRDGFIFYKALTGIEFSERDRPDVVGNIPMYYTFTVWVSSLSQPILVALLRFSKSRVKKLIFLVSLILLCLAIGSKSSLMMIAVYFYLTWKASPLKKFKWGIITALFLFSFYFLMKVVYVPHVLENDRVIFLVLDSLFRRVSVINYSIASFVFEYFVGEGGHLPGEFSHLKQFVFYSIYGYLPGGAPVPLYMQGFYLFNDLSFSLIYTCIVSFLVVSFFKFSLNSTKGIYFEIVRFLIFYGVILMCMGFIEDVFIRSLLPIGIFCLICNFPKIRFSERFSL